MKKNSKIILVEYINHILREDGDGGGAGDGFGGFGGFGGYGDGGFGMGGGMSVNDDVVYKTFVKGWVDLFKTATSATKSIAASSRMLVQIAFDFVVDAVIPFYKARYGEIFQKHQQMQNQIRQEYQSTYQSITQALASNDDFLVSAFMYDPSKFFKTTLSNPSAFVTTFSAINAPDAISNTLDVLSGGMFGEILEKVYKEKNTSKNSQSDWNNIVHKFKNVLGSRTVEKIFNSANESKIYRKFVIVEDEHSNKPEKKGEQISDDAMDVMRIMLNPKVLAYILQGKKVQDMVRAQRKITEETLSSIVGVVQNLMTIKTIEQLESIVGKHIEIPNEELAKGKISQNVQSKLIQETQTSVKSMYVKMLKTELSHLLKTVPKEHKLAQAYFKAIKTIEQL